MASTSRPRRVRRKVASNQPLPEGVRPLLSSPTELARYESEFKRKKVTKSMYLSGELASNRDFQCLLDLREVRLMNFCCLSQKYSIETIRAFYTNFEFDERHHTFQTTVRGTRIRVSTQRLADIIHLPPPNGYELSDSPTSLSYFEDYSKSMALAKFGIDPQTLIDSEGKPKRLSASMLSVNDRLLHYIITHCFMNKAGSLAVVSDIELFFMYCISEKKAINYAFFMMQKMASCVRKAASVLVYASSITAILRHFGVHPYEEGVPLSSFGLNMTALTRMGVEKIDGQWVRREEGPSRRKRRRVVSDTEGMTIPEDTTDPGTEAGPSGSASRAQPPPRLVDIAQWMGQIMDKIDRIETKVDELSEQVKTHMCGAPPSASQPSTVRHPLDTSTTSSTSTPSAFNSVDTPASPSPIPMDTPASPSHIPMDTPASPSHIPMDTPASPSHIPKDTPVAPSHIPAMEHQSPIYIPSSPAPSPDRSNMFTSVDLSEHIPVVLPYHMPEAYVPLAPKDPILYLMPPPPKDAPSAADIVMSPSPSPTHASDAQPSALTPPPLTSVPSSSLPGTPIVHYDTPTDQGTDAGTDLGTDLD